MAPAGLERHLQRTHRRELRDLEEAARVRAVQLGEARRLRSEVHTAYGDWGEIRALILARDVWTCHGYGRQGSLQVHHMSYRSMTTWQSPFDGHEYVAFHRDGLVTLCQGCHFPVHRLPFMRAWPQKRPGHPSPRFLEQLRRATFSQDLRIGLSKSPDERLTEYAHRALATAAPFGSAYLNLPRHTSCDIAADRPRSPPCPPSRAPSLYDPV